MEHYQKAKTPIKDQPRWRHHGFPSHQGIKKKENNHEFPDHKGESEKPMMELGVSQTICPGWP
jgi:hypothetical protein